MHRLWRSVTPILVATLLMAGCVKGPRYVRPTAIVPPAYKESEGWKLAQPGDQKIRGKWWEVFGDSQLNSLEEQIEVSNETLKVAEANFRAARAQLHFSRSSNYPNVTAGASISTNRESQHRALGGASAPPYYGDFLLPVDVTYEVDLWGRIRHTVEASRAQAQASASDLETAGLSLHAELASDYFQLRALDAEKQLLDSTVTEYEQALQLAQNRFNGGLASEADVALAQTQLETTRTQDIDTEVNRAEFEHAIAALTGQPASSFHLAALSLETPLPPIPIGLPSQLLERRPDISAAERRVAAANEQIGVAAAAFYPSLILSAAAGFEGSSITNWLLGPSIFWTAAPQALLTVFDAGRRRSVSEQARAAYDQVVASYRQTVITAFQEVEDNLAALRILEREAVTQQAAVTAAERSVVLANNRYKGGVTSYLEVITSQSAALTNERAAVDLMRRRMTASVLLIKALGGGWDVANLPSVN